jgi:hypothetical protein
MGVPGDPGAACPSALCAKPAPRDGGPTMFARYYVFMNHPFEEVEASLLGSHDWLLQIAQGVGPNVTLAELGVDLRGARLRKKVEMSVGEAVPGDMRTSMPFTWRATGISSLFPTFQGDIEISHWRPAVTQLAVSATYEPPFGSLGRVLDRAALHLLAEVLVKDFVDRVAAAVEVSLATQTAV